MYIKALRAITALISIAKDEQKIGKTLTVVLSPIILVVLLFGLTIEFLQSPSLWGEEDYTELIEEMEANDYFVGSNIGVSENLSYTGTFTMPCDSARISSDYGYRMHPIDKVLKLHTGIDFVPNWHSNIYSVSHGIVMRVQTDNVYGKNILIAHSYGDEVIYSFYAHLSEIFVTEMQSVTEGEIIAIEGGDPTYDKDVGKSTGHHLHFEIRTGESYLTNVDPKKYLGGFK